MGRPFTSITAARKRGLTAFRGVLFLVLGICFNVRHLRGPNEIGTGIKGYRLLTAIA
jgi:hypothetical protein